MLTLKMTFLTCNDTELINVILLVISYLLIKFYLKKPLEQRQTLCDESLHQNT